MGGEMIVNFVERIKAERDIIASFVISAFCTLP